LVRDASAPWGARTSGESAAPTASFLLALGVLALEQQNAELRRQLDERA
jgi:hypothetical protein